MTGARIEEFLNEIEKAGKSQKKLALVAEKQVDFYLQNFDSIFTAKSYLTQCRKAVKARFGEHIILEMRYSDNPKQKILALHREDSAQIKTDYVEKVKAQTAERKDFDAVEFIGVCRGLLTDYFERKHHSVLKLAIGIAGLTGRRIYSEVLGSGFFQVAGDFEMIFSGQSKTRFKERTEKITRELKENISVLRKRKKHDTANRIDKLKTQAQKELCLIQAETAPYKIPVLANANLIYRAWQELCSRKAHLENTEEEWLKLLCNGSEFGIDALEHSETFRAWDAEMGEIRKRIKDKNSSNAKQIVRKIFPEKNYTVKALRGLYAVTAANLWKKQKTDVNYISGILGHSKRDLATGQSYQEYDCRNSKAEILKTVKG
ncbi:MAG: hypothetical protein GY749_48210 [Desulfobacteraceae bacterium]|nr:hypothetical protein [Desulfobacteraceae bacterium]